MAPSVLNEGWMCTSYLSHVDLIQDIKLLTVLPDLTTTCMEEKVPLPFCRLNGGESAPYYTNVITLFSHLVKSYVTDVMCRLCLTYLPVLQL